MQTFILVFRDTSFHQVLVSRSAEQIKACTDKYKSAGERPFKVHAVSLAHAIEKASLLKARRDRIEVEKNEPVDLEY